MTELSENKKKIPVAAIVITVLSAVVLLQAMALWGQAQRQSTLEKKQQETAALLQSKAADPRPHPGATQASRVFPGASPGEDPWQAFDAMSQRVNGLMQHALVFGSPLFQQMPQDEGFDFTPAVDLEETKDAYIVKSDLPGLAKDKIDVTVKNNMLTIEGVRETSSENRDPKKGYFAQERSYGSFARSLSLPGPVDESKIVADYKDGVLTVTLPKAPGQKEGQKVAVQ